MSYPEIDRFQAASEDGEIFTVITYQQIDTNKTLQGTSKRLALKEMYLSDGRDVNYIDDDNVEIVATRQILHRID